MFNLPPYSFDSLPEDIKQLTIEAGIEPSSVQRNFPVFVKTFSLLYPDKLQCPPCTLNSLCDTNTGILTRVPAISAKYDVGDPREFYDIQEASGSG